MSSKATNEGYLVIGGSGFLGSYIVQALVDRKERNVAVYDLAKPGKADVVEGVTYFCGDILNEKQLIDCLQKTSTSTVFHTVSPVHGLKESVYYRVNIEGTRTILSACQAAGVKCFVFTSSASVVWCDQDLSGLNEEQATIPEKKYEAYNHTKGIAEQMALQANGAKGMKVAALRPCGMIGPRDRQAMWRLADAYNKGQHKYQMGPNKNLVDYSYVGNIADAHLLAADRLLATFSSSPSADKVSGQAFFITDGKPRPYWDFPHMVFKQLGFDGKGIVELPKWLCLILAFLSELWASIFGGLPAFPRFIVIIATQEQWFNIDKARRVLGYEPRVPLEEGVRLMVKWWKERGLKEHTEMVESRKSR